MSEPVAVVMAAGKSTRMKSQTPKALHQLCGAPVLWHVLDALEKGGVHRKIIIVGHQADELKSAFSNEPGVEFALQAEQRGTGHAVMMAEPALRDHHGPVIVIAGDQPLIRPEMIHGLLERQRKQNAACVIGSATVDNPFGLGRIKRDAEGRFVGIVEQKDSTPEEALIREINFSFYAFDGQKLLQVLSSIRPENAQKEYYITDAPALLLSRGETVIAEPLADETDMYGINHRGHLAEAHRLMQLRIHQQHLDAGVTIVDPRCTTIDIGVTIGADTIIHPNTVIRGDVSIGERCQIGPFAHVRSGTRLADDVVIGAFVEVVRSTIGARSAARHLAYLGDVTLGQNVNVGGGFISANFDQGVKAATIVGDNVSLGSGSILIAPVTVGDNAQIAAGAVVTKNATVPSGSTMVGMPAKPASK